MRKPSTPLSSQNFIRSIDFLADLGIVPVQIGLLLGEEVKIVLALSRHPTSRRSREKKLR